MNILLSCLPPSAFYIAKLWRVFKCKGGVLFQLPKCIPIPKPFSVSVSSSPCLSLFPLLFHPTLLDFPSPTGSPDDTTASTLLSSLLPIPAHIIFFGSDFTSKRI